MRPSSLPALLSESIGAAKVIEIERPEGIVKSLVERTHRRLSQYDRFIKGSRRMRIKASEYSLHFHGASTVYGISDPGGLSVLLGFGDSICYSGRAKRYIIYDNCLHGMFVGFGTGGRILGFGLMLGPPRDGFFTIMTPVREDFDGIYLSTIILNETMTEEYVLPLVVES